MSTEQPAPANNTAAPTTYANCSLYVGDLRSDVTDQIIFKNFSECGNILSIRICRDVKDGHSLGYAYVNFQFPESAQKALDTLNGKQLNGKPCRIMWVNRDPSQRKSNEGNICVKGLDKNVTLVTLQDVFSHFGSVSSCTVRTRDDGTSLGYGFVQFAKVEDSVKALEACKNNPEQFKSLGEKVCAEKFIPKNLRPNNANETYTNLYVKNIGKKFFKEDLMNLFKQYGDISSPVIMLDDNNESRRFGFVCFKDHQSAVKAKEAMDGKPFKWKDDVLVGPVGNDEDVEQLKKDGYVVMNLYAARAQKKRERETTLKYEHTLKTSSPAAKTNVFIRNLADSVTDDDLRTLLKVHGEVKSCVVMKNQNGTSKGYGFCDFSTNEAALRAISNEMGQLFHDKPLYLAFAQKKQDRARMLETQFRQPRPFSVMNFRQPMFFPGMNMFYGVPNMFTFNQRGMYNRPGNYNNRPFTQTRHNNIRRSKQANMAPQMQAQPNVPVVPAQPAGAQVQPAPVTPENEKQRIGEIIYAHIMPMFPSDNGLWGKLTGMLLESIPIEELRSLVNDEAGLNDKINQAKEYYDQHMNASK